MRAMKVNFLLHFEEDLAKTIKCTISLRTKTPCGTNILVAKQNLFKELFTFSRRALGKNVLTDILRFFHLCSKVADFMHVTQHVSLDVFAQSPLIIASLGFKMALFKFP